ncbi:flavodoxin [Microbacterium sp. X-17]|uniref:flavodoxin family protein n=1 Tax=Microbacterium sp. X-17 TaxID=3144404 RepID=UPI0031F4FD37
MTHSTRLLVVHHSPTARTQELAGLVLAGTRADGLEGVEIVESAALTTTSEDVLAADGYLLGTTANFGYLSGALKHFFDTTYDETRELTAGRPFSFWIHGGHDTTGAERAMRSITTGYGWRLAAEPLVFVGELTPERRSRAQELGATIAAMLL